MILGMGRASRNRRARRGEVMTPPRDDAPVKLPRTSSPALSTPDDLLAAVTAAANKVQRVLVLEDAAILEARSAGVSWDQISMATGYNRETLRRRYREAAS